MKQFIILFLIVVFGISSCNKILSKRSKFTSDKESYKFGEVVQLIDQSKGAVKWEWTMPDGSTSTLQNPTYIAKGDGVKEFTLVTTTKRNKKYQISNWITMKGVETPPEGTANTILSTDYFKNNNLIFNPEMVTWGNSTNTWQINAKKTNNDGWDAVTIYFPQYYTVEEGQPVYITLVSDPTNLQYNQACIKFEHYSAPIPADSYSLFSESGQVALSSNESKRTNILFVNIPCISSSSLISGSITCN